MQNGTKPIISVLKEYRCGSCVHEASRLFRGEKKGILSFPGQAILLHHQKAGYLLMDTGYSTRIYSGDLRSRVYRKFMQAEIHEKENLHSQLIRDKINPDQIPLVILSHLHPDHIGGLRDFPKAQWLVHRDALKAIPQKRLMDLIFPSLLPEDGTRRAISVNPSRESPLPGFTGVDYFGDQSLYLVDLPGHCRGQMGFYLPEWKLFHISDASWGERHRHKELKFLPARIQHHSAKYRETRHRINRLKENSPEIRLITSHGSEDWPF